MEPALQAKGAQRGVPAQRVVLLFQGPLSDMACHRTRVSQISAYPRPLGHPDCLQNMQKKCDVIDEKKSVNNVHARSHLHILRGLEAGRA